VFEAHAMGADVIARSKTTVAVGSVACCPAREDDKRHHRIPDAATPAPARHEEVLNEIAILAWSVRMHCEIIERYAGLGHIEGIDLAAKDARACLVALLEIRKELRHGTW
jgi:hypothetical protein